MADRVQKEITSKFDGKIPLLSSSDLVITSRYFGPGARIELQYFGELALPVGREVYLETPRNRIYRAVIRGHKYPYKKRVKILEQVHI